MMIEPASPPNQSEQENVKVKKKRPVWEWMGLALLGLFVCAGIAYLQPPEHIPTNQDRLSRIEATLQAGATAKASPYSPTVTASDYPTTVPAIDIELGKVPIYPGAQRLGPVPNQSGTIAFEVRDSLSDVVAFYRDTLPKSGWALNIEWSSFSFDYMWTGSEENAPSILHLDLRLYEEGIAEGRLTTIHMDLVREPSLTDIPLYPGAQHVEIHDGMVRDPKWGADVEERLVSYLTNATPSQVQEYYAITLPQHGWLLEELEDYRFSEGTIFGFGLGVTRTSGIVNIIADEQGYGRTRVELRLRGNRL